jgi:hypothetical protein
MKSIWLIGCLISFLSFTPALVVAECPNPDYTVGLPDSWCCPNRTAQIACWSGLGKPLGEEVCHIMGCSPDHINRIKKDREEKKSHEQKPSDCTSSQVYAYGHCKDCYEAGLHVLDGRCVTNDEYARISKEKIRGIVESRGGHIDPEKDWRSPQPAKPPRDRFPPPVVQTPREQTPSPNEKRIGRLVVRPCGNGIWSNGVCCCPDGRKLPSHLYPRGYGPLPSPDTLWDECHRYGCRPPPHSYE